jgi:hypothetical protein
MQSWRSKSPQTIMIVYYRRTRLKLSVLSLHVYSKKIYRLSISSAVVVDHACCRSLVMTVIDLIQFGDVWNGWKQFSLDVWEKHILVWWAFKRLLFEPDVVVLSGQAFDCLVQLVIISTTPFQHYFCTCWFKNISCFQPSFIHILLETH